MTSIVSKGDPVGIIGAGHAGQAMASVAVRAGRQVVIANSRGPQSLVSVATALGPGVVAGTVDEAARCALTALAVPWASVPGAVEGLEWDGGIVIDMTNAILFPDLRPAPLGGRTSSEIVADLVPNTRLVKAANTLSAEVLGLDPRTLGGQRVLFVSGDDASAKAAVTELLADGGFFPIDIGDLVTGGSLQQFGGPLSGENLVRLSMAP